jgi:hypothetical protein
MKYTICTIVNDVYLEFLYYFVKSALEKCENMSELIVLYTGENFKPDPIYLNPKIKLVKYCETIKTTNIWDDGWQKNVELKTQFLRHLAVNLDQPIFLIDVDCYFLKEFIDVVDPNMDILVTKRVHTLPYIASFVGLIKPKRCVEFIDVWRYIMSRIPRVPRETLALVNTIPIMKNKISIQEVSDTVIGYIYFQNIPEETKILHFKGRKSGDAIELIKDRLENLKTIL